MHAIRRPRVSRSEFIALSASTTLLTAVAIDVVLPAFAEVRAYFGLSPESTATAQIVTVFFLGQVAQLIYGVLSDRFGRLPLLRAGFLFYFLGGGIAAYAPTFKGMLAGRFLAGAGASGMMMITVAGVRDRHRGDEMARVMSLIFTILLFTPILAPFAGVAILSATSWRIVFLTPPLVAVAVFLWSLRLEESLPPQNRLPLRLSTISEATGQILRHRQFLCYTGASTFLFAAFSAYISSSERIIGKIYARPDLFSWIFAGMGIVLACCTFANARLVTRFGAKRTLRALLAVFVALSSLLLTATLVLGDPPPMAIFFPSFFLLMGINMAIEPNCSALALEPFGESAGTAAAIYGTTFFVFGALAGAWISSQLVHGVLVLIASYVIFGALALGLVGRDRSSG